MTQSDICKTCGHLEVFHQRNNLLVPGICTEFAPSNDICATCGHTHQDHTNGVWCYVENCHCVLFAAIAPSNEHAEPTTDQPQENGGQLKCDENRIKDLSYLLKRIFRWAKHREPTVLREKVLDMSNKVDHLLWPDDILRDNSSVKCATPMPVAGTESLFIPKLGDETMANIKEDMKNNSGILESSPMSVAGDENGNAAIEKAAIAAGHCNWHYNTDRTKVCDEADEAFVDGAKWMQNQLETENAALKSKLTQALEREEKLAFALDDIWASRNWEYMFKVANYALEAHRKAKDKS